MNVKLLRKIQKHILKFPEQYDQNAIAEKTKCGTKCCLGGWAVVLSSKRQIRDLDTVSLEKAERLCGLDEYQGERLFGAVDYHFSESSWPRKFVLAYEKAKSARGRARVASRRIDHFIATKGAE